MEKNFGKVIPDAWHMASSAGMAGALLRLKISFQISDIIGIISR